jgi:adenylate cyclase
MISKRVFLYRLYIVFTIVVIWVLFSLVLLYNIVEVDKGVLESRRLSFFSLAFAIIGTIVVGAEAFFLKDAFRKLPIWLSTILRMTLTFILFLLVSVIVLLAYWIFRYQRELSFIEFERDFVQKVILTPSFLMGMVDLGVLSFVSILVLEISDKYGPGGLRNLIRGRYHKPRKENRIFLFLDINDSTTIAEKIGHEKYFNMLHDFFADITEPILANWGHIYQYVGDEVVICWKNNHKNKRRCLKFIHDSLKAIKRKENYYMKEYGVVPSFKAGVHAGDVTVGYIGIIKKELVFSGDTLNTTARIRSKCHELKHSFILSVDFLHDFDVPETYSVNEIGEMEFKGRKEKSRVYSLELN